MYLLIRTSANVLSLFNDNFINSSIVKTRLKILSIYLIRRTIKYQNELMELVFSLHYRKKCFYLKTSTSSGIKTYC